ncbi:hypothetical protein LTDYDHKI_CDS0026 [Exiguobacterium phage phiExGM16]
MNGCRTHSPGHDFSPVSGWCDWGCGHRDDGRLVIHGTEKRPGPEYTPEQLDHLQRTARAYADH